MQRTIAKKRLIACGACTWGVNGGNGGGGRGNGVGGATGVVYTTCYGWYIFPITCTQPGTTPVAAPQAACYAARLAGASGTLTSGGAGGYGGPTACTNYSIIPLQIPGGAGGTTGAGTDGGPRTGASATSGSGRGGGGGGFGSAGGNGEGACYGMNPAYAPSIVGGYGGTGGAAVSGNSYITWSTTGSRYGSIS